MQPREAFGVVVRTLGMLLIAYALWNLGFAFSDAVSFTKNTGVPAPDYVTLPDRYVHTNGPDLYSRCEQHRELRLSTQ